MVNLVLLFISLFLLWTGLVFPLSGQEAIAGAILSLLISSVVSFYTKGKESFKVSGIFYLIIYSFVFIKELVKANLTMAKIVLTPSLPISPKIVEVKTSIKSKVGRAFLANSITLTPGTLSVDLEGDTLYIHVVDGEALGSSADIVKPFEKLLKGAFDK